MGPVNAALSTHCFVRLLRSADRCRLVISKFRPKQDTCDYSVVHRYRLNITLETVAATPHPPPPPSSFSSSSSSSSFSSRFHGSWCPSGCTAPSGFTRLLMAGLINLVETESYFMGTESHEGLPVWYTLLKWHICSVCLQLYMIIND